MKKYLGLLLIVAATLTISKTNAQLVDLSTGKTVTLVKHAGNGMMLNTETQRPVHIYIDAATNDTIYGRTGEVINGKVIRKANGGFGYDDGDYLFDQGEYRLKRESDSAGYKKKIQSDGDVKVKYDNYKRKVEKDGDVKVKEPDSKTKVEEDGTMKVKEGDFRGKIDEEGNLRMKDDNSKVKVKTDGNIKVKDKSKDYKGKIDENGKRKEKVGDIKRKIKDDKIKVKTDD